MIDVLQDVEGVRIGNFAIDWIPEPMLSIWDEKTERWIEQKIHPTQHVHILMQALTEVSEFHRNKGFIDEELDSAGE
jgi:hypothetical protein